MNEILFYLLKSIVWISSYAVIYVIFLRNERYFKLNRLFLITGIFSAFLFPFITFEYVLPVQKTITGTVSQWSGETFSIAKDSVKASLSGRDYILAVYVLGILVFLARVIKHIVSIVRLIQKSNVYQRDGYKLIQTAKINYSFSFFSYVFVNPSVDKIEQREIVHHEVGHISQKHWFDLLLIEVLIIIQWFNPIVWFYSKLIRQNQEYLADQCALSYTENKAVYKATLLNQLLDGPVISLTNYFNYSLNQKRFKMMTHKKISSLRKLRLLAILPVLAGVFYSFSEPRHEDLNSTVYTSAIQGEDQKDTTEADKKSMFKVNSISWKNNTVYSSERLTKELGIKVGDMVSEAQLDSIIFERIEGLYMDHGYVFFNVNMDEWKSDPTNLKFALYEEDACKVRNVVVEGKLTKKKKEIENVITLKKGELFSKSELVNSIRALSEYLEQEQILVDVVPKPDDLVVDIVFTL